MKPLLSVTSRSLNNFFKNIFACNCTRRNMDRHCEFSTELSLTADRNLKNVEKFIPKLTANLHKGQCGRIGVIGGSFEYTGAPYFAAISALKVGVDLVHVFCCREAGSVIKSYSPELIVHPFLDSSDVVNKIQPWLERLHVLVIGPGMGRDADLLKNVGDIITHCKTNMKEPLTLIIDADGLHLITEDITLIKGYRGPLILTPNRVEYERLSKKLGENNSLNMAVSLNALLVQKGSTDVITNGMINHQSAVGYCQAPEPQVVLNCKETGSYRRCGGQGDVLSGCMAAFTAWLRIYLSLNSENVPVTNDKERLSKDTLMLYSWAAYGACVMTRTCSRLAFEENGRGMTTSDMITYIHKAFKLHFGA